MIISNNLLLSIGCGIIVGVSYPPLPFGFFSWFGFIPLLIAIKNSRTKMESIKYGYLSGITAHFIILYWIGFNSGADFFPVFLSLAAAVFYLALFWSLFSVLFFYLINYNNLFFWFAPFIWIAIEWLRSFGPLAFPWLDLALTQTKYINMIQLIDIAGSSIITLWILFINLFLYYFFYSRNYIYGLCAISLPLLVFVFGYNKINAIDYKQSEKNIDVVVTQPSIDPNEKWKQENRSLTFNIMHNLFDEGISLKPDIIIWPETALPSYLRLSNRDRNPLQKKVNDSQIPLFTGTIDRNTNELGNQQYYNGSILLQPNKKPEIYHKVKLVPFAEYVPLSEYFPSLNDLNFGQGNFTRGNEYKLFQIGNFSFSNLICFESSIPNIVRKFVKKGAQFLIIQANDGWLGNTSGPYQHFELAKLRAIENRRSVVRSANTGISGIILPTGRVVNYKSIGERGVFKEKIPLYDSITFFSLHGNLLGKTSIILTIFCIGAVLWLRK